MTIRALWRTTQRASRVGALIGSGRGATWGKWEECDTQLSQQKRPTLGLSDTELEKSYDIEIWEGEIQAQETQSMRQVCSKIACETSFNTLGEVSGPNVFPLLNTELAVPGSTTPPHTRSQWFICRSSSKQTKKGSGTASTSGFNFHPQPLGSRKAGECEVPCFVKI